MLTPIDTTNLNVILTTEKTIIDTYKDNKTPNINTHVLISVYDNTHLFHEFPNNRFIDKFIDKIYNDISATYPKLVDFFIKVEQLCEIFTDKDAHIDSYSKWIKIKVYSNDRYKSFSKNNRKYLFDFINKDRIYSILSQKKWYDRIYILNKKIYVCPSFVAYCNDYLMSRCEDKINIFHKQEKLDNLHYYIKIIANEEISKYLSNKYSSTDRLEYHEKMELLNVNNVTILVTPIECAISMYSTEASKELSFRLKQIIIQLSNHTYIRPPQILSEILKKIYPEKIGELSDVLCCIKNKYKILIDYAKANISTIDENILCCLIVNDDCGAFSEYIKITNFEIDKTFMSKYCLHIGPKITDLLVNIDDREKKITYILLTESLNHSDIRQENTNFIIEIGKSILFELVENNKLLSLYYLFKLDPSLSKHIFTDKYNSNILHITTSHEIAKLVIFYASQKNSSDMVNVVDDNNDTALIIAIKNKSLELVIFLLELIQEEGQYDAIIENLIENNRIDVFTYILSTKNTTLFNIIRKSIDVPNKRNIYPIMQACQLKNEDMYKVLIEYNPNEKVVDGEGNNIYHYIVRHNILIGSTIVETPNNHGLYPSDLARISKSFWKFVSI